MGGLVTVERVRAHVPPNLLQSQNLTLEPVIRGLEEPTYVTGPDDGTERLFVLERAGRVRVADANGALNPTPFLDLTGQISLSTEEGLLGFAFAPAFNQNGYVYVDYTANDWSVHVVRYTVSAQDPDQADPSSAMPVLVIPKQSKYHNGGMLTFGPDGDLYVSVGDDEASEQAQALDSLYGKILRLDVSNPRSGQPYAIPPSNPFVNTPGARGEVWAYGLRNPWRFSFDRTTGDMWIGDVGDAKWEEIDFQSASSPGGDNFGWPFYEGEECEQLTHCQDAALVPPVVTYNHNMNCAVMGGYVYRGPLASGLSGSYLFGDLCTGGIFSIVGGPGPGARRVELGFQPIKIDSFGEDAAGNVYVSDMQDGVIYRIDAGSIPSQ